MKYFKVSLRNILPLVIVSNLFAWTQQVRTSEEVKEVLFLGLDSECTLTVNMYENDLVDIAINAEKGETIYFHSERTCRSCVVSSEPFIIGDKHGVMVLVEVRNGGNYNPYESLCLFVDQELTVFQSITPAECHSLGGPGSYYPNLLDVDANGVFDHLSYPDYLFYLPDESQALKRQLWLEFCEIPSIDSSGKIKLEDNTLAILTDPESQPFRDVWVESMSEWLMESAELSQSHPSILEARGKVWAFKEALSNNNYELITELYPEL